jgi:hypothetical protein
MKTRGGKKERPDGGQEECGGAPHGKSFGSGMKGERKGGRWGGRAAWGTKEERLSTISVGTQWLDPVDTVKTDSIEIRVRRAPVQAHNHLISPSTLLNSTRQLIWGSRSAHDTPSRSNEKFVIVFPLTPPSASNRTRDGREMEECSHSAGSGGGQDKTVPGLPRKTAARDHGPSPTFHQFSSGTPLY